MPSGRTHDRITVYCLPVVTLIAFWSTRHGGLTLLALGGFLFGGLMCGPDLDVRSVQSQRWGWLAWIWRPYRGSLRHRSWLSHGPIAGTLLRLLYLGLWGLLALLLGLEIVNASGYVAVTWSDLGQGLRWLLWHHRGAWLCWAIGLEAGAMSHSLSDWLVSHWRRQRGKPHPKTGRSRAVTRRRRRR